MTATAVLDATEGTGPSRPGIWWRPSPWYDRVMALVLAASVLIVHNVSYLLNHPFWVDEAWVADSIRAPLSKLPWLTSSTPLGWTLLLRLVPGGGQQDLRLVPLAFSMAAVVVAYYLGRELGIGRAAAGFLTGVAVLLVPAMLVRDDLKQYTAEACGSLLVMLLVVRLEKEWTSRRLLALGLVISLGLVFDNSIIFVGAAALLSLALETAVGRQRQRLLGVVVVGAGTAVLDGIIYLALVRPNVIPSLTAYWDPYYLSTHGGASTVLRVVHQDMVSLAPNLGFHSLTVDSVLALLGIGGLIYFRRFALAAMVPITFVLVIVASVARRYPFGDLRTSTFWLVMVVILMAGAVLAVIHALAHFSKVLAGLAVIGCLFVWVQATRPEMRSEEIPNEDVRAEVNYFNAHRRPGDIVIVNDSASWGFAYYDQDVTPSYQHISGPSNGFIPVYPKVPWIVQMDNRDPASVNDALAAAMAKLAAENPPPTGSVRGRIWIIRSHLEMPEIQAWSHDLNASELTTIAVGPEPILLYQPAVVGTARA
jgi:hypothetical protein